MCYKKGEPRKKVYAVVEKDDKYVVIETSHGNYRYMLPGGGIEDGEDIVTAIKRECVEEVNMVVEYVRELGTIEDESNWEYKGHHFVVKDSMHIVLVKYVAMADRDTMGLEGEFKEDDRVTLIDKDTMLESVAEFVKYGIKLS